ncbi:E3 ubiquitin-protein ligase [Sphingopyxis sp. 113P3]|nr:E3 ubiquitin-protein ligase [Sphingopyxis sp. 113P3]
MTITPSPGDATPSAPQAARTEDATPLSMTKRTRAKAAMKISASLNAPAGRAPLMNMPPGKEQYRAPRPRQCSD